MGAWLERQSGVSPIKLDVPIHLVEEQNFDTVRQIQVTLLLLFKML